jgi:hypothetical protein
MKAMGWKEGTQLGKGSCSAGSAAASAGSGLLEPITAQGVLGSAGLGHQPLHSVQDIGDITGSNSNSEVCLLFCLCAHCAERAHHVQWRRRGWFAFWSRGSLAPLCNGRRHRLPESSSLHE